MKKLYIHIGMEKTGSTTIQESLDVNRKILLREGFSTLSSCGRKNNRKLSLYALEQGAYDDFFIENNVLTEGQRSCFDRGFEEEFKREIFKLPNNVTTVILSSEHLHSRLKKNTEIKRLKYFLMQYFDKIEVICYVREQSLVAASWYSTVVKSGNVRYKNKIPSFSDYLRVWCTRENHYFNYFNMLEKWSSVFGKENLNVRLFDKKLFVNSNLLDDFYSSVGLHNLDDFVKVSPKNESLSNLGLFLGRLINNFFPRFTPYSGIRYRLMNVLEVFFKGKAKLIDEGTYTKIYKHFENDNLKMSIKYFGKKQNVFKYRPPKK